MTRVVMLLSGGGGNLALLHHICRLRDRGISISGAIADRDCPAESVAASLGIPTKRLKYSRERPEALREALTEFAPDLIVTTFHKIIDSGTLKLFPERFVNLHYSLLPSFGGTIGTAPIDGALRAGCKILGSTVHFVDDNVDSGPIVGQCCFAPGENRVLEEVVEWMFRCSGVLLFNSLLRLSEQWQMDVLPEASSFLRSSEGDCLFSPGLEKDFHWPGEDFWQEVKIAAGVRNTA